MIKKEIIQKNKNDFYSVVKAYKICDVNFIDILADMGLFESPASTMLNLHNAFPGGLVDHLLRVAKYAINMNDMLPNTLQQKKESLIRVSLLHSIGKVGLYTPCKSEWHIKNQGKMYEFNEKLTSMTVGERSIFYLISNGFGNEINDLEYQAILNHDKPQSDKMSEWHTSVLGELLKMAIKLSIIEEKQMNI
jgi:hypothetical protein